jgi:aspartyl-tRNA synthetase
LGQLRNYVGEAAGLRTEKRFEWAWIVDFPLFVRSDDGQLESAHHPFTAPMPEFLPNLLESKDLESLKGKYSVFANTMLFFSSTL